MKTFETESIDLATFLAVFLAVTGITPQIYCRPGAHRAIFQFPETDDLKEAIISYERGASLPSKKLLTTRSSLFREASRVCREGGSK